MTQGFESYIERFKGKKIVIVGDVMLDKYIHGEVSRINPEAPVPIVHVSREERRLGGAANVAHNIASLEGTPILISLVGEDEEGKILSELLDRKKIRHKLVPCNKPTIVKTRVIGLNQQLVRIDYENTSEVEDATVAQKILEQATDADAIIISDYAKGTITKKLVETITKATDKPVVVDPKHPDPGYYTGVTVITPNEKEARALSGLDAKQSVEAVARHLEKNLQCKVVITRGPQGMSLLKEETLIDIPTVAKQAYDVSGAGDTVISTLALALASGAELDIAATIANQAAGIVVEKFGTATVTQKELLGEFVRETEKIKKREHLAGICEKLKQQGKTVVFTNGCFDILHLGHVKLLQQAKALGDVLILGLNTDESVKRLKGPSRPIIKQDERAEMLAALEMIDYVTFFDEDTPVRTLEILKPSIHVKGGDYQEEYMPETPIVKKHGGKIVILPYVKGLSTTNIIRKIEENKKSRGEE